MLESDTESGLKSRRQILKLAGTAGAAGLAGYTGDGTKAALGQDQNLSGTKIQFWDMQHIQSEAAATMLEEAVSNVEQRTGATIEPTWGAWTDDANGKWKRNIARGNRPALLEGSQEIHGQYVEEGWFQAAEDYLSEYPQETADAIQPTLDLFKSAYRGFDPALTYEIPIGTEIGSVFAARTDHFEQAGIDIEAEYPPTSFDEVVDLGTRLQENGPGQFGFQVYGSQGDVTDEGPLTWSSALGGIEGVYLNEDWSDVMYDSSAWKTALGEWAGMHLEHNLSSPDTPSASDETATQLLMAGSASMTQLSAPDHGIILSETPELIDEGKILYAPHWKGETTTTFSPSNGVLTAPEDADQEKWNRKQQVAYELQMELLSEEMQTRMPRAFGMVPTRTDITDQVTGTDHKLIESQIQMRDQIDGDMIAWSAHPRMPAIKWQIPGPIFQNAVRGELTAEEATTQAAQQVRNQVDFKESYTVPGR